MPRLSWGAAGRVGTSGPPVGLNPIEARRLPVQGNWIDYAGVVGGIPNYVTQSGTTVPIGESTASIQTRINNCLDDQFIQFNAGTYTLTAQLVMRNSRMSLRGAVDANGRPATIFNWSSGSGGGNGNGLIAFQTTNVRYDLASSHTNSNVVAGFTAAIPPRGSTRVTLAGSVASITIGQPVIFNAAMGAGGNWSDLFVSDSTPRAWTQIVYCIAKPGGNDIEFSPAINPDFLTGTITCSWLSGSTWVKRAGIENIHMTRSGSASGNYVGFLAADECWVLNCKTDGVPGSTYHFFPDGCYRCEVRHSELYRMTQFSNSTYVFNPARTSQMLIIDNWIHAVPNIMPMFGLHGSVYAYNYGVDFPYDSGVGDQDFLSQGLFAHGSLQTFCLFEGNWQANHHNDNFGEPGSRCMVWIRNRCRGDDDNPTQGVPKDGNTKCFFIGTAQRDWSIVGNVLGDNIQHDTYQSTSEFANNVIFGLESLSIPGLQRKGNWNYANDAIPASEALAVDESVPLSLLYASRPSWYPSTRPWPFVDTANIAQSVNFQNLPAGYRAQNGVEAP